MHNKVKVRSTIADNHWHWCFYDCFGDGETTGTYNNGENLVEETHTHTIENFILLKEDKHTHEIDSGV
jgi:hypothetical protein